MPGVGVNIVGEDVAMDFDPEDEIAVVQLLQEHRQPLLQEQLLLHKSFAQFGISNSSIDSELFRIICEQMKIKLK